MVYVPSNVPHPTLLGTNEKGQMYRDILRWITGDFFINKDGYIISPKVTIDPIPEAATQPIIAPRLGILHSMAGPSYTLAERLVAYWRRADITGEGHFAVSYGQTRQSVPVNRRADCNFKANSFWISGTLYGAVSFETEDNGYPTLDSTPWTLDQMGDIISILTCINVCYPKSMWCTNPAYWNDRGIGHHCQFPEWSSYTGKTCPGAARIRQMDYIRQQVANKLSEYGTATGWQCGKGIPV